MVSKEKFEEECRELWRMVAASYAVDGSRRERMAEWADQAVADYRARFAKEFDSNPQSEDRISNDSLIENLHSVLSTTFNIANFTVTTIPTNGVDDLSTWSWEVFTTPGVTIDMIIDKLAKTLYGHGLLNVIPGQISYMTKVVNRERRHLITDKYSMKPIRLMKGNTVLHDSSIHITTDADVMYVYRLDIKL